MLILHLFEKRKIVWSSVSAFVLTLLFFIGKNYDEAGTLISDPTLIRILMLLVTFVCLAALIIFFDVGMDFVINYKRKELLFDNSLGMVIKVAFVLMLLWMPYLVATYPGSTWWDCSSSIKQVYGVNKLNNWNPFAQSLLIGGAIKFGSMVADENIGLCVYNLIQMSVAALVFSYGTVSLVKYYRSGRIIVFGVICYGMLPVYPIYLTTAGKDANWSCFILMMAICLYRLLIDDKWFDVKSSRIVFVVAFLGICILRNAGIYIALVCGLMAVYIAGRRHRRHICVYFILAITIYSMYNFVLLPSVGVDFDDTTRDSWNVQFQQIARFVNYYPDEVSDYDAEVINRMISFEDVKNQYNPNLVDTITDNYHGDTISGKDKGEFVDLYLRWLKKHPYCYLDAMAAKSYGYFTPYAEVSVKPFTVVGVEDVANLVREKVPGFNLHNISDLTVYKTFLSIIQTAPLIRLLFKAGTWTWMFIILFFISFYRARKMSLILQPGLLVMAGLIIVPANNYFRYVLSIVYMIPFFICAIYGFGRFHAEVKEN